MSRPKRKASVSKTQPTEMPRENASPMLETSSPHVSVVVPVYNAGNLLRETLNALKKQTYENFEVLLVDDGSTDGSPEVCDRYQEEDPRFRVFHRQNSGVSETRNFGISRARGQYLVFCDADDIMTSLALETMVSIMDRFTPDLISVGFSRFYPAAKKNVPYRLAPMGKLMMMRTVQEFAGVYLNSRTNLFGVSIWAKMYRLDIIREHNIRFQTDVNYEEDCLFNLQYLEHVTVTAVEGSVCYKYRQMETSLSKGYKAHALPSQINGYHKRQAFLSKIGMDDQVHRLDGIMLIVFFNDLLKVARSNLTKEQRIAAYQAFVELPEVQDIFQKQKGNLKSPFKQEVCKATLAKDAGALERLHELELLRQARNAEKKKRARRLPAPIHRMAQRAKRVFLKVFVAAKR